MSALEYGKILSQNQWFGSLSEDERYKLLENAEILRRRPGKHIFRLGEEPKGFYAIVEGSIRLSNIQESGKEAILAILDAGNWFGEQAIIEQIGRSHDAIAHTASILVRIPTQVFVQRLQNIEFAQAMLKMMAIRTRHLYRTLEDSGLRSTDARIARRLLALASGDALSTHGRHQHVKISQDALAMMLGFSRQTLNKALNEMAGNNMLTLSYGTVTIHDFDRLEQVSRN